MSLYALGDLHLSFQSNKPMDKFGSVWKKHDEKILKYVNQIVGPEDTLVLTGDHSWGRSLMEAGKDIHLTGATLEALGDNGSLILHFQCTRVRTV